MSAAIPLNEREDRFQGYRGPARDALALLAGLLADDRSAAP